jgi:hypothetical protein
MPTKRKKTQKRTQKQKQKQHQKQHQNIRININNSDSGSGSGSGSKNNESRVVYQQLLNGNYPPNYSPLSNPVSEPKITIHNSNPPINIMNMPQHNLSNSNIPFNSTSTNTNLYNPIHLNNSNHPTNTNSNHPTNTNSNHPTNTNSNHPTNTSSNIPDIFRIHENSPIRPTNRQDTSSIFNQNERNPERVLRNPISTIKDAQLKDDRLNEPNRNELLKPNNPNLVNDIDSKNVNPTQRKRLITMYNNTIKNKNPNFRGNQEKLDEYGISFNKETGLYY